MVVLSLIFTSDVLTLLIKSISVNTKLMHSVSSASSADLAANKLIFKRRPIEKSLFRSKCFQLKL